MMAQGEHVAAVWQEAQEGAGGDRETAAAAGVSPPEGEGRDNALGEEGIITSHRVLESYGSGSRGISVLHSDLFDGRKRVVISALQALGRMRNQDSIAYLSRLFTHGDADIRCAAVRAVGEIGHAGSLSTLLNLFKTSQGEQLRNTVLETAVRLAPDDGEVLALVRAYAGSAVIGPSSRAVATRLLMEIDQQSEAGYLLEDAASDPAVLEELFEAAESNPSLKEAVVGFAVDNLPRLTVSLRCKLVGLCSPFTGARRAQVLLSSLADPNPEIRRACYRVLGKDDEQVGQYDRVVELLAEEVEPNPHLEEEAQQAVVRMEESLSRMGGRLMSQLKDKIADRISELFGELKKAGTRVVNDTHELGWIIGRSREYLEYYGDEQLKQAIVGFLKRSGNYSADDLLKLIKESAVKVEVRHFDGYNALLDLVKNPKRSGIALIARELALAKLGKRQVMYRLMRLLYLSRLFNLEEKQGMFLDIFIWARDARLYRLGEAALYALARVSIRRAADVCRECMVPPVKSKILAIASIRLLKYLSWDLMEQSVVRLFGENREPYIMLNLVDALAALDIPFSEGLVRGGIKRLESEYDPEILSRVSGLLGEKAGVGMLDDLIGVFAGANPLKKEHLLEVISRIVQKNRVTADLRFSEFLYRVIREEPASTRIKAAVLLYLLHDDYAVRVLHDLAASVDLNGRAALVRGLNGALRSDVVSLVGSMVYEESGAFHEALRETLLSIPEQQAREGAVELMLKIRGAGSDDGEFLPDADIHVDLEFQKSAYKFEKEHISEQAVMFTDIKGYSRKAQALNSMELTTMLHEYEGILLPIVSAHQGELIKRMGDGHMFTFDDPLNAALAGIRIQKSLKRYNSFREEKYRVTVRVGIHWGKVVRKAGDVYGNTVNIAARLESSAREGAVYVSDELQERIKSYVISREIGPTEVKGITEPILVFEPYEIAVDLPEGRDPTRRKRDSAQNVDQAAGGGPGGGRGEGPRGQPAQGPGAQGQSAQGQSAQGQSVQGAPGGGVRGTGVNRKLVRLLQQTFVSLNNLCLQAERGEVDIAEMRRELARRYKAAARVLKNGGPTGWRDVPSR
ncbi:MAG: adenylate/guanylate cyclase domain-containing protein [Spirochaetota bacterium]